MSPDPVDPEEQPAEPIEEHAPDGLDLARTLARVTARSTPGRKSAVRRTTERSSRSGRVSGAHPDDRDPQSLDTTLGRFVGEQGWETELRVHGVFSRWDAIVGREVAQHATPDELLGNPAEGFVREFLGGDKGLKRLRFNRELENTPDEVKAVER